VEHARSFARRVTEYVALLIVGPIVIVSFVGLSHHAMESASIGLIGRYMPFFERLKEMSLWLAPYFMVTAIFTAVYMFVPNTKVKWKPAVIGGVTAGLLWAIVGKLFTALVVYTTRLSVVYAGFAIIEVPLNSPEPVESIRRLRDALGDDTLVGAGTVMTAQQVRDIVDAGGRLIVMPHSDAGVIRAAKATDCVCIPGIATPTEGFAALATGADALKLFPAELLTPKVLGAMRSVFPPTTRFFPVGGITTASMSEYVAAGASGFGLGSALYRRGDTTETVAANAKAFVAAWARVKPST
jgi:2-dehydro-3-deoxyphosphogalactonate aldolase